MSGRIHSRVASSMTGPSAAAEQTAVNSNNCSVKKRRGAAVVVTLGNALTC
jgi:hypothetical protein